MEHGANVAQADTDGSTALMLASSNGHEAVVRALVALGADVSQADKQGRTALMAASSRGHEAPSPATRAILTQLKAGECIRHSIYYRGKMCLRRSM